MAYDKILVKDVCPKHTLWNVVIIFQLPPPFLHVGVFFNISTLSVGFTHAFDKALSYLKTINTSTKTNILIGTGCNINISKSFSSL